MRKKTRYGTALALLLAGGPVHADGFAYGDVVDLRAEGATLIAEHHHDWVKLSAFLRLLDRASGRELLRRESPALSTVWLTPDERYVVGLSQVKYDNPYQLFILGRDGRFVHQEAIHCSDPRLAGLPCGESVSNFVFWYDKADPALDLQEEKGQPSALSFNTARDTYCRRAAMNEDMRTRCAQAPARATLRLRRP
jgi:hypothetical protein